jgi:hypothetical protein
LLNKTELKQQTTRVSPSIQNHFLYNNYNIQVKKDEMGREFGTNWEKRYAYRVLVDIGGNVRRKKATWKTKTWAGG